MEINSKIIFHFLNTSKMKMIEKSIKILNKGNALFATMPNGEIIPMQVDLVISNKLERMPIVECVVTLKAYIPIDEFELIKSNDIVI